MAQWEEKLGAILNDPLAMSKIMAIAQSLDGGKEGAQEAPAPEPEAAAPEPTPAAEAPAGLDLDPRLMAAGMQALAAWRGPDDSRTALLQSLRPFVKPERYGKLDKAVRVTKLSRVIRAALDTFKGGEGDV